MGRKGVSKRKPKAKSKPFSAANIGDGVVSTHENPAENMPEISTVRGKGAPLSKDDMNQRRTKDGKKQKGKKS